jgi:hypothetical protein
MSNEVVSNIRKRPLCDKCALSDLCLYKEALTKLYEFMGNFKILSFQAHCDRYTQPNVSTADRMRDMMSDPCNQLKPFS